MKNICLALSAMVLVFFAVGQGGPMADLVVSNYQEGSF
jgi:hypothetical protein